MFRCFSSELFGACYGQPMPGEALSQVILHLSRFVFGQFGEHWSVSTAEEATTVANEITASLKVAVLPLLNSMDTKQKLVDYCKEPGFSVQYPQTARWEAFVYQAYLDSGEKVLVKNPKRGKPERSFFFRAQDAISSAMRSEGMTDTEIETELTYMTKFFELVAKGNQSF